jgi:hypothetical protein
VHPDAQGCHNHAARCTVQHVTVGNTARQLGMMFCHTTMASSRLLCDRRELHHGVHTLPCGLQHTSHVLSCRGKYTHSAGPSSCLRQQCHLHSRHTTLAACAWSDKPLYNNSDPQGHTAPNPARHAAGTASAAGRTQAGACDLNAHACVPTARLWMLAPPQSAAAAIRLAQHTLPAGVPACAHFAV